MLDKDARPGTHRSTLLSLIGLSFLLIGVAAGITYAAVRPVTLSVAVSASDGNDAKVMQAVAARFANDRSPIRLSVIETAGSSASLGLFGASKADIAVVRGDLDLPRDAQSLAVMRNDVVVLWAPADHGRKRVAKSKISSLGDLAGRHVGLVSRSNENIKLLKMIMAETGVAPESVKVSQFGVDEIARMAHDPALDAFMSVGSLDGRTTSDAIRFSVADRGEPVFLPIDASDAISRKHRAFKSVTIPGRAFAAKPARPSDEIETISVDHLLVAHRSLSDGLAAAFTRQLLTARQGLARDIPDAARIEKPDTDKDAPIPAHQGAVAYVDGTERTFLEKYSDYFWVGILSLSILGSAGAWIGHYLKRDERDVNTIHRDRLLNTIIKVREAGSEVELTSLQAHIDVVLRETLDCYDDGAIDEGGLMALSLVLDRLHSAFADRRAQLGIKTIESARFSISQSRSQNS